MAKVAMKTGFLPQMSASFPKRRAPISIPTLLANITRPISPLVSPSSCEAATSM
jgi:hypothetical protein